MSDTAALFARAVALEDAGRVDEALAQYRELIEQAPVHADAWHNYGLLLARLGRLAEAGQSHRAYLQAHPGSVRARTDLADVLLALGGYQEAVDVLSPAAEQDAGARIRRGVAFSCLARFADARADFALAALRAPEATRQFLQRTGGDPAYLLSPENIFLSRGHAALTQADWTRWDAYVGEMRRAAADPGIVVEPAVAFMAQYTPLDGRERHALARSIAARIEGAVAPLPPPPPRRPGRMRIGVLSPDFREHLNAHLLLPLFELLDRERFQTYAYSTAPDDGSEARRNIGAAAGAFRDLHASTDAQAAARIRSDDIDILVDAAGHTSGGRFGIVARRPARIQALYLGFPSTLGSKRVDYAVVDALCGEPEAWSETLLRLPHTWFLYDFRKPVPEMPLSRQDYGLPANGFVYCAFHRAEKISPDGFALWMEILRAVPRSVLWCAAVPEAARRKLRLEASAAGIDPARLAFAPFEPFAPRYLARQRLADLMLDALHHNAVTTGCDALGVGLPMLSLRGTTMTSRSGESLLRAAGLAELVAADRRAYVDAAVSLARDPARLGELRRRLAANRGSAPLFDTAGRVRELEACFERMLTS